MSWDYRIIRRESRGQKAYVIHEVGFDEEGKINSFTYEPVYPAGESIEELKTALKWMLEAIDKPVLESPVKLDNEYFEPFTQRVWTKRQPGTG